jgi:23S rRNA (adenine2503-C2)-methyltransferase
MTISIFSLTLDQLCSELQQSFGKGRFYAAAIYREIFKNGNQSIAEIPELSQLTGLGKDLSSFFKIPSFEITRKQENEATKFALAFEDGCVIESVIIPAAKHNTLCVSSQVGCAMNCAFCATGKAGFTRNLLTEEIVAQVWAAIFALDYKIDNIVFMGMGEPLDNIDNVAQALYVISDPRGINIPQSKITISTVGHCAGIADFAKRSLPHVKLAISINAADNKLRSKLMPINKKFPLETVKEHLQAFPLRKRGVFFVEYVLLAGVNDSREKAETLAKFLNGLPARVNLIAYNENPSCGFKSPSKEKVWEFAAWLREMGVFVRVRRSVGANISAACGQLAGNFSYPPTRS